MGTKNNPTPNDCYDKAEPDEPMFVLLARDPQAPRIIRRWVELRLSYQGNPAQCEEAMECADAMDLWREKNR